MTARKNRKKTRNDKGELLAVQRVNKVDVLPLSTVVVCKFLEDTQKMFRARAMRMKGHLGRINESG